MEPQVYRKEMSTCILDFIRRLPESYQTVLVFSELDGLKNNEIADLLGITLETVKVRLHRAHPGKPPLSSAGRLACGSLTLDRVSQRVWLRSEELTLTPKAVRLLEYLMTHPDELVTRKRLLDVVWGWSYPVGTRAVDTRVAELRRALGDDPAKPCFIETTPGQGYRFVGEVEIRS